MADDKPKQHTLSLNRGSMFMLSQLLLAPGSFDNTGDTFRAGEMLEWPEFELPNVPGAESTIEQQKEWGMVPIELHVSERQRETLKRAVEKHIKSGQARAGRYTNRLVSELGLKPED